MVAEVMSHACAEDEAVAAGNNCGHALLYAVGVCLPDEFPAPSTTQLQPVGKETCLLRRPNHHDHSQELVVALAALLLLEDQHELAAETGLQHDPVHCTGEGDVGGQEHNVLPAERGDALVLLEEVGRHLLQAPLPLAGGTRNWAGVGTELAPLLVVAFLAVDEPLGAAVPAEAAGEGDRLGHLLHGQVPDAAQRPAAGGADVDLGAAVGADEVAAVALYDGREDVVVADRTLEQVGEVLRAGARHHGHTGRHFP